MNPDLSVYVHIPFCTVKCGYCDFNAYAGMDSLKPAYRDALIDEAGHYQDLLSSSRIATLSFGGGTPGELPASDIAALIIAIRANSGGFAPGAEISLEANPGTTGVVALRDLRASGVTRISFGAQSFDPAELRFLDRIHSPEAIAAAVVNARAAGIPSVGMDLIYGLPGQDPATWEQSLRTAISLRPDHISCYALTVEPGTRLSRRVREGAVAEPDADAAAAMYESASTVLGEAGYRQYEISNWAMPGHESRHNRVYWTGGDYLGLGAGAHGYIAGERYANIDHPKTYVATVQQRKSAVASSYRPDGATAMFDWLSLWLRLAEGFDPAAFAGRFGHDVETIAGPPLAEAEAAGLLTRDGGRVSLTPSGRLMHGEVSVRILAHLRADNSAVARYV